MKVKERESWVCTNVGKGGKRPSQDPFNKAHKGYERNPKAKEYYSQGLEGYHHYSERAEYKYDESESKKEQKKQDRSSSSKVIKNVVGRVVAAVAGAVIVVSTYTAMTEVKSQNCIWSSDMTTATIELVNEDGSVLRELPATVNVTQEDPTCNQTGTKTYTATAEDEDEKIYTDVKQETISALGHETEIVSQTIKDGKLIIVYECSRCHEQYTVTIDINEND